MVFAEFQTSSTGWNGKDFSGPITNVPLLGSEGVFRCDGRKALAKQIDDAKQRANTIQHLHGNGITGLVMFRSYDWRFSHGKPISQFIPL